MIGIKLKMCIRDRPCLVSGLDEEEAYHLVLLAGGDDGEILVLAEHALSGAQRFQLHSAMRAGASANGVRKVVFTFHKHRTCLSTGTFICLDSTDFE